MFLPTLQCVLSTYKRCEAPIRLWPGPTLPTARSEGKGIRAPQGYQDEASREADVWRQRLHQCLSGVGGRKGLRGRWSRMSPAVHQGLQQRGKWPAERLQASRALPRGRWSS